MNMNIKLNGPKIRLFVALCLCFFLFVATTTTPSDGNGCSSEEDKGDLLVTNNSNVNIFFQFAISSDNAQSFKIEANSYAIQRGLKSGFYPYVILIWSEDSYYPVEFIKGEFTIAPLLSTEIVFP